ncbi:MAG: HAMP domain-containing histidine kinase [Eubacterium sp.]|nr:HAMP domain-containing histidine kinase [Eubacterium sp.]
MKIFAKLYTGIMVVLVASLLIAGYFMVDLFQKESMKREYDICLERYRMFRSILKGNIEVASNDHMLDEEDLINVVKGTVLKGRPVLDFEVDGRSIYKTMDSKIKYMNPRINSSVSERRTVGDNTYIVCHSKFVMNNVVYTLVIADDITSFVNQINEQRKWYIVIFLGVLTGGTIFAVLFSNNLTKPIRVMSEASKEIAKGNYGVTIKNISSDELGDLTKTFNYMSEMIREKVDDLELAVKQKEDFIAAFAHETKSPMTSVIGYADYIYQNRLDDSERKEAASAIMNEGMRIQALSEKLMDIVSLKQSGLKKEEIQTNEMMDDVILSITPKVESREASIEYNVEDDYIFVDYDLFKTVIINVIDNALKAGAKKLKITGSRPDSYTYALAIADNGIGIPESELRRVKEAFYVVDKSRSRKEHGAGLGLALSNRIMNFHGGNMDIKSKVGEGTKVTLNLPLRKF